MPPDYAGHVGDHVVLGLAQQQTDGGLVVRVGEQVVDGGHVHAELAEEGGFELDRLQFDDDIAAQLEMVEEQVAEELIDIRSMTLLPQPSSC